MKTVFKNSEELSHIWAHRRQAEGRTPKNSSAFFEGDKYYSFGYHYCLARHLPDGYVAINLEKSTRTTEKQKGEVRRAVSHLKVIYVLDPESSYPQAQRTRGYVACLVEQAAAARPDGNRPSLLAEACRITEHYNLFCDLLEQPQNKIELPTSDPAVLAAIRKTQLLEAKAEKVRTKAREAQAAIEYAERITDWRKGLTSTAPYNAAAMLRVDDDCIRTSRGAAIPIPDAIRLWPVILRVMAGSKDFEVGMQLGNYRLTKIRRDGSIVVNCHDIAWKEIEGVAKVLGLLNVEETA